MWSFLAMLIFWTSTCNSNLHTPPKDRDDWVDPADMINYDSSTRTMTKVKKNTICTTVFEISVVSQIEPLRLKEDRLETTMTLGGELT